MQDSDLGAFINAVSGQDMLAVEENFGDGYVRLRTAEAERRQAKHDIRAVEDIVIEMLRNARDAHAHSVYVATGKSDSVRTFTIIDDGDGIPAGMQEHVFEPRVTSKLETMVMDRWGVHGRGMALYSIKCNTLDAHVVTSARDFGCSFAVAVDTNEIPEKADQSTLPELVRDDEGELVVGRGPHNIVRTIVEFALESKGRVAVYLGSPTDIAATIVSQGKKHLTDEQLLFCDDPNGLPIVSRPAVAADAGELVSICSSIGLSISERTAHRILAGSIPPVVPSLRQVDSKSPKASSKKDVDIYHDSRGLHLSPDDLARFSRALENAFDSVAERYYLTAADKPKIRVGKDCISVKFPFEKDL